MLTLLFIEVAGPVPEAAAPGEAGEFAQTVRQVWQTLLSPELQTKLLSFKILFVIVFLGFLIATIYLIAKTSYLEWKWTEPIKNFLFPGPTGNKRLMRKWKRLKKELAKGKVEAQRKVTIVEAFNLVNKFAPKEDLKDLTEDDITDLERFRKAITIVGKIKQEPGYRLAKDQASKILDIFEKALTDLDIF